MNELHPPILNYRHEAPAAPRWTRPSSTDVLRCGSGLGAGCTLSALIWLVCFHFPIPSLGFARDTVPWAALVLLCTKMLAAAVASAYPGWKSASIGLIASVPAGLAIAVGIFGML